jgi:hypothetical protein
MTRQALLEHGATSMIGQALPGLYLPLLCRHAHRPLVGSNPGGESVIPEVEPVQQASPAPKTHFGGPANAQNRERDVVRTPVFWFSWLKSCELPRQQ